MKKKSIPPAATPMSPKRQAQFKEITSLRREELEAEATLDRIRKRMAVLTDGEYRPNEEVTWWAMQFCRATDFPWDDELEILLFTDPLPLWEKTDETRRKKVALAHMAQYAVERCRQKCQSRHP